MSNIDDESRVPIWFFAIGGLFPLWNLFGLAIFLLGIFVLNTKEALLSAGLSDAQADMTLSTPNWVNIAFGVAVVFGVLGSIVLIAKRRIAIPLLAISLFGVLVQNFYTYFLSNVVETMGVGVSPMVIVGSIGVIPIAILCAKKGWLK